MWNVVFGKVEAVQTFCIVIMSFIIGQLISLLYSLMRSQWFSNGLASSDEMLLFKRLLYVTLHTLISKYPSNHMLL